MLILNPLTPTDLVVSEQNDGNERLPYSAFPTAVGRLAAGEAGRNIGNPVLPTDGVPVILGTRAA